jgi:hypothetical protein
MNSLEKRVAAIEKRNAKVELDKRWETSWARRLSISILTYVVVVTYLFAINNKQPFINAVVPATGFLLSTLVLRKIKLLWQKDK